MKPFRCLICGETYLGAERPDRCPYCGSSGHNLVSPGEWLDYGVVAMSKRTNDLCLHALEFEASNCTFYKMSHLKAETMINLPIFARLSDQEAEHAELIAKMLGVREPEPKKEEVPEKDEEKFILAHARELRAVKHYQQILEQANETRVRQVFAALLDVESEHLKIANYYR